MANAGREPPQVRGAAREQKVFDDRGGEYMLGERLSKGGQGTIVRIKGNVRQIVKLANTKANEPATLAWVRQLERIRYLPVQDMGLPVVMPLAYISKPRPGYVMELMEGLVPLESIMTEFDQAMREGRELQGFVQSGGLGRRLALLARLARVLASLHGLGIAHGDLSPSNVFVSSTHTHAQVWLIDVDNLCYAVRDSSLQIYTPDYGAPELLRGDLGVSTYTDIWSFAVIAFQLLTHLHPIKSGLLIDGDAELEADALSVFALEFETHWYESALPDGEWPQMPMKPLLDADGQPQTDPDTGGTQYQPDYDHPDAVFAEYVGRIDPPYADLTGIQLNTHLDNRDPAAIRATVAAQPKDKP